MLILTAAIPSLLRAHEKAFEMTVPDVTMRCAICGGTEGTTHRVREMMFGTRQTFEYFRCVECGCCQLCGTVDNAAQYPSEYHAFEMQPRPRGMRGVLRRVRNRGVFRGDVVGRLLSALAPYPVGSARNWFARTRADIRARILDVGCGSGELVRDLREAGFPNAVGIDPFVPREVVQACGGSVRSAWLHETGGEYDVVMMHHVLEHMQDQEGALRDAARLLRPGGHCLVRVPIIPSHAWDRYRENWVQLDAPRHLFVHSERSLTMLAARAGLELECVEHDSTEFQFAGSELYERDLPLAHLPHAYSRAQLRRFRRAARRLNIARRGDQAAFYFRKSAFK
jgi:SAM-dependent methyltransferase